MTEDICISAVIPTYNREKTIRRAIDSALSQDYAPTEIIVVDDGSTDNTRGVVETYGQKIRYVCQKNAGVSAARNRGVLESNFELIQSEWFNNWINMNKESPRLRYNKTMYEESIAQANGALQVYEEKQAAAGNEFPELSVLEANDKLESIFNKIRDKKLTKINKQLRTKKQEKTKYTKTKIKKEITKSKTKITKSKKRTKKGGKKRTTKKNKKRTTKKSKKRTTKKRK